ncbi:MAG: hypothetical protein ACXAC2_00420 [Candidatus Kariarchaeaceae archaeon]|jgi:hypothetical protein
MSVWCICLHKQDNHSSSRKFCFEANCDCRKFKKLVLEDWIRREKGFNSAYDATMDYRLDGIFEYAIIDRTQKELKNYNRNE